MDKNDYFKKVLKGEVSEYVVKKRSRNTKREFIPLKISRSYDLAKELK